LPSAANDLWRRRLPMTQGEEGEVFLLRFHASERDSGRDIRKSSAVRYTF